MLHSASRDPQTVRYHCNTLTCLIIHRISEAETRIAGGLIEEVIDVAEGELKLVETMAESKAYVLPRSVVAIQPKRRLL